MTQKEQTKIAQNNANDSFHRLMHYGDDFPNCFCETFMELFKQLPLLIFNDWSNNVVITDTYSKLDVPTDPIRVQF